MWAAGAVLVGVGFGLTAVAGSAAAYLGTVAIWTVGEVLPAAVSGAIVSRLSPAQLRGRYAGVYGLAWSSGWLTSSLGGTRLLSINPPTLWIFCTILCGVAATGLLVLSPKIRERSV